MGQNPNATKPKAQLDEEIQRHADARRLCAQSYLIHPDWDAEDHLAFLDDEIAMEADEPLTVVAWPVGPSTAPAEEFVAMWIRSPQRCFEGLI